VSRIRLICLLACCLLQSQLPATAANSDAQIQKALMAVIASKPRQPCKCKGSEESLKVRLSHTIKESGATSEDASEAMIALGDYYRFHQKYPQSEQLFLKSIESKEKNHGAESVETALVKARLALLYFEWNKPAQAKLLSSQAIKMIESDLGKRDLRQAMLLEHVGDLYTYQSQMEKARASLRKSLAIREEWLGKSSLMIADSLEKLAPLYQQPGGFPEAERLLRRALEIRHAKQPGSLSESRCLQSLATAVLAQQRYGEAVMLMSDAAKIEKRLPGEHPQLILTAKKYAELLHQIKQPDEAKRLEAVASSLSRVSF